MVISLSCSVVIKPLMTVLSGVPNLQFGNPRFAHAGKLPNCKFGTPERHSAGPGCKFGNPRFAHAGAHCRTGLQIWQSPVCARRKIAKLQVWHPERHSAGPGCKFGNPRFAHAGKLPNCKFGTPERAPAGPDCKLRLAKKICPEKPRLDQYNWKHFFNRWQAWLI